jgi:predicted outer membrane repeat protein
LTIVDSLLTQNSAGGSGGGIYTAFSGTTNISNSTISFNTANSDVDEIGDGGGMYFRADAGRGSVSRSTINGNRSKAATTGNSGGGGGIHTSAGRLDLINCTVSGNVAERSGGGMTVLGSVTNVLGAPWPTIWQAGAAGSSGRTTAPAC